MTSLIAIIAILLGTGCSSSSPLTENVVDPNVEGSDKIEEMPNDTPPMFQVMEDGDKMPIYYSENKGASFIHKYNAVRIGEYLWMNGNFINPINDKYAVNQHQINFGLDVYRIDTLDYKLTPQDVNKYIGQYYSLDQISHMQQVGNMYEEDKKINRGKWGLPSKPDFRQLFAMCGDAQDHNVRFALCHKIGDTPLMKETKNIFWLTRHNTNKYGFNLIYAGQRAHNNGYNWGVCHMGNNDCHQYNSKRGDFVLFYGATVYPSSDLGTVIMHDYPDTKRGKEWALKPMRWCRKLTDKELGYKLYVNKERTDIIKLELTESPPNGYEILPNGYLRGFYVQYILDNPSPIKTVSDLRKMELAIPDVMHGGADPI
jgi:uncharacterized protein (TIGR02145 family)